MPANELRTFRAIPDAQGVVQFEELTDAWRPIATIPGPEMASEAEVSAAIASHAGLPDVHHSQAHEHPTHGDINFTGTISADGDAGLTGQKTIGGYTFTFKKGLLVGFQPP